jgi:hypothetical protein
MTIYETKIARINLVSSFWAQINSLPEPELFVFM